MCATNSVRALDTAFVRHGRFDYLIPVGTPDAEARRAIWQRYLATIPHTGVDLDDVVNSSDLFTPADIEFAARRTAQLLFERLALTEGMDSATTADLLGAIADTRPTLTAQIVAEFEQDIANYARL